MTTFVVWTMPHGLLRQRMLEDMAVRGLRSDTQRDYVRMVRSFAAFLDQSPDTATAEDVRQFARGTSEILQQFARNAAVPAVAEHLFAVIEGGDCAFDQELGCRQA